MIKDQKFYVINFGITLILFYSVKNQNLINTFVKQLVKIMKKILDFIKIIKNLKGSQLMMLLDLIRI